MKWPEIFRIFTYSFEADPISKHEKNRQFTGAGISQPDAMPDLRGDGWLGGRLGDTAGRDTNEFLDINSNTDRIERYKEYERLRIVPEIEMAMTTFADETCLAGDTIVQTLLDGPKTIKWLAENKKEPFLVYCWDFEKNDYTLGWASAARLVKKAKTVRISLDNGKLFVATPEHRVLLHNGQWITAGEIKTGHELMPFYRIPADPDVSDCKIKQFPRIFTNSEGWMHERQFIDEWKTGRKDPKMAKVNQACRMLAKGLTVRETMRLMKHQWNSIEAWINAEGFCVRELKWLGRKEDHRRVVGVHPHEEIDVYDLSVRDHENFCGDSCIFHNCQKGENGHLFDIQIRDQEIKKELEHMFFHREMVNIDRRLWNATKKLFIKGDKFLEIVIDPENPKAGVQKISELPPETMYRIETTKGRLIEFQQSKTGPDLNIIAAKPVAQATEAELMTARGIRFTPNQIVHLRINDDRKDFYPYGVSLIEAARVPATQLRLMEDAMLVYRLSRAPERRVFYIDVGQMPSFKAEAFIDRIKDQFRKKKTIKPVGAGASAIEERWHAPAQDEDYWLPIRPNSGTKIDTLPGAQNLGEIDDAKYFRDKLFLALNFPKNRIGNDDVNVTRIALSAQDVNFARMIERLQQNIEDGLWQIADRHLKLIGYPPETYEDLIIKMTPPSDWREMSRAEVVTNRINNANSLKGSLLYSDFDILTKIMKVPEDEVKIMQSRIKMQKLDDLKLQVMAQNPALLGVGVPNSDGSPEIGAEAGGPNPMLAPGQPPEGGTPPPEGGQPTEGQPPEGQPTDQTASLTQTSRNSTPLADPTTAEIKKYDLQIQTYSTDQDREERDFSLGD